MHSHNAHGGSVGVGVTDGVAVMVGDRVLDGDKLAPVDGERLGVIVTDGVVEVVGVTLLVGVLEGVSDEDGDGNHPWREMIVLTCLCAGSVSA